MNVELKALLTLVFDAIELGKSAAVKKNFILLLPKLYELVTDIPLAVKNWNDLPQEIASLPGTPEEDDLLKFVEERFGTLLNTAHMPVILSAGLKSIQDVVALAQAIKT